MNNAIEYQDFPLPETIRLSIDAGFTDLASLQITKYLNDPRTPEVLKERLKLEETLLERRREAYPYTIEEAEALLAVAYPSYKKGMISSFIENNRLSWAYVDGIIHIESRVIENARKRCPELLDATAGEDPDLMMRDQFIELLEKEGEVKARITAEEVLTISDEKYLGKELFVNLPLPRHIKGLIEDIKIEEVSDNFISADSEDALMRTAQFKDKSELLTEFKVRFSYTITSKKSSVEDKDAPMDEEYLKEEGPHIIFTPYIKALAKEITKGTKTQKERAKAIYLWVTEHVEYSFMREYSTIDNISEYASTSLKGDCGVQALLFITLCRVSGIAARWQSGWYVTPSAIYNHDWAEVMLNGKWYSVDCSFGGGAYKSGNTKRHMHYFLSLDIFRMIANSATCLPLTGKKAASSDPVDNQRGEVECEGIALPRSAFNTERKVISFAILH